jgi:hypothetical protein
MFGISRRLSIAAIAVATTAGFVCCFLITRREPSRPSGTQGGLLVFSVKAGKAKEPISPLLVFRSRRPARAVQQLRVDPAPQATDAGQYRQIPPDTLPSGETVSLAGTWIQNKLTLVDGLPTVLETAEMQITQDEPSMLSGRFQRRFASPNRILTEFMSFGAFDDLKQGVIGFASNDGATGFMTIQLIDRNSMKITWDVNRDAPLGWGHVFAPVTMVRQM